MLRALLSDWRAPAGRCVDGVAAVTIVSILDTCERVAMLATEASALLPRNSSRLCRIGDEEGQTPPADAAVRRAVSLNVPLRLREEC